MQVISGVNNSAFFAQSAYSASTASYDVNGYPITSYLPESGVGYNAVQEISAINGSAIAQYGHEAQWLVHDDTLVHASNSAQYALGVNLSAVAQLLGVDETVLYSGNAWTVSQGQTLSATVALSENVSGFKEIEFRCGQGGTDNMNIRVAPKNNGNVFRQVFPEGANNLWIGIAGAFTGNGMSATVWGGRSTSYNDCLTGTQGWWGYKTITAVVGIGRRSNG